VLFSIASAAKLLRSGFALGQQFAHPHQRGLAGKIELAGGVNPAADRVLKLANFTRKWIQPMPRPSARIAAAAVSRVSALASTAWRLHGPARR
jgi:hypothetical protein